MNQKSKTKKKTPKQPKNQKSPRELKLRALFVAGTVPQLKALCKTHKIGYNNKDQAILALSKLSFPITPNLADPLPDEVENLKKMLN